MSYKRLILLIFIALMPVSAQASDLHLVRIKRIKDNIYKARPESFQRDAHYIKTKYCYEDSFWDEAVVRYDPRDKGYSRKNRILFETGEVCGIVKIADSLENLTDNPIPKRKFRKKPPAQPLHKTVKKTVQSVLQKLKDNKGDPRYAR